MTSIKKDIICYILLYQLIYSFNQLFTIGNVIAGKSVNQINYGENSTINGVNGGIESNDTSILMNIASMLDNGFSLNNNSSATETS
jgi:hypothetical protein